MMRASASLGTTFFGMPIPLPVMTAFMGERRAASGEPDEWARSPLAARGSPSCIRLRVQRKEIVPGKAVLPAAELTDHLGAALGNHLAQLVGGEKLERRQRALTAAAARVAERHVEARIDLFVVAAVKDCGHDVFDRHLLQQCAEPRRLLDALLDPLDG